MQITKSCTYPYVCVCQAKYQVIYPYYFTKYVGVFCKGDMLILLSFNQLQSWPLQSTLREPGGFSDWCVWEKEPWLSSFFQDLLRVESTRFPECDRLYLLLQRETCGCPTLLDLLGKFIQFVCLILDQFYFCCTPKPHPPT